MAAVRVPLGGALVAIVRGVLLQIMDVWVWGLQRTWDVGMCCAGV
jgi:hypothetical protein